MERWKSESQNFEDFLDSILPFGRTKYICEILNFRFGKYKLFISSDVLLDILAFVYLTIVLSHEFYNCVWVEVSAQTFFNEIMRATAYRLLFFPNLQLFWFRLKSYLLLGSL